MIKKIFIICGILIVSIPLFAQKKQLESVILTLNSTNGVYKKGDTVKVYGRCTTGEAKEFTLKIYDGGRYHYEKDLLRPEIATINLGSESRLIFSRVYESPKVITLSVSDNSDRRSEVGFAVAPEEFKPGYNKPEDFNAYWENQLSRLRKCKLKPKITPVEIKNAEDARLFNAYAVEINMPEGNPARGYMAIPKDAPKGSLPIALFVHSAGVNRPYNRSSVETAVKYAKFGNGAIAFDLNAHGFENDRPQEYYDNLNSGELKNYSTRPLTTRDDFYFRLMYLREVRTMDFLCSLKEWDGKRALVHGESQGGGQAEALAGLDHRITAALIVVPALTDFGAELQSRQCGWPSDYSLASLSDQGRKILPYFDGALFIQNTTAKIFMIVGFIDETCHAAGIYAAFNSCPSTDKAIFPSPYRWHSGVNKPWAKEWYSTIGKWSWTFMNDYLK